MMMCSRCNALEKDMPVFITFLPYLRRRVEDYVGQLQDISQFNNEEEPKTASKPLHFLESFDRRFGGIKFLCSCVESSIPDMHEVKNFAAELGHLVSHGVTGNSEILRGQDQTLLPMLDSAQFMVIRANQENDFLWLAKAKILGKQFLRDMCSIFCLVVATQETQGQSTEDESYLEKMQKIAALCESMRLDFATTLVSQHPKEGIPIWREFPSISVTQNYLENLLEKLEEYRKLL